MINIASRILPAFKVVNEELYESYPEPFYGHADFETLISLILLLIMVTKGDGEATVSEVSRLTAYDVDQVRFMLDQYEGRNRRYYLWRRKADGRYYPLI